MPSLSTDQKNSRKHMVKNAVKYYQAEVVKLRAAQLVDTKYQSGVHESFKNGELLWDLTN
jgi:hypothetical protein